MVFEFFPDGTSQVLSTNGKLAWLNNSGDDCKISTRKSAAGGSCNLPDKCPIDRKS